MRGAQRGLRLAVVGEEARAQENRGGRSARPRGLLDFYKKKIHQSRVGRCEKTDVCASLTRVERARLKSGAESLCFQRLLLNYGGLRAVVRNRCPQGSGHGTSLVVRWVTSAGAAKGPRVDTPIRRRHSAES